MMRQFIGAVLIAASVPASPALAASGALNPTFSQLPDSRPGKVVLGTVFIPSAGRKATFFSGLALGVVMPLGQVFMTPVSSI